MRCLSPTHCSALPRYYAKAFKKDLPQCLDVLSDILLNSKIDTDALEVEKRVILREMEEVEKQTEEVIFDRLHMMVSIDFSLMLLARGSRWGKLCAAFVELAESTARKNGSPLHSEN